MWLMLSRADNQYVFAINFDAISENGTITVNESIFILKETIKAQEQRAKAEGKELRFAVVSDKFTSVAYYSAVKCVKII